MALNLWLYDPDNESLPEKRRENIIKALALGATMKSVPCGNERAAALIFPEHPDDGFVLHWADVQHLEDEGIITHHIVN